MERSDIIVERLEDCIRKNEITEDGLLKIFNIACDYLNMRSFKELAEEKCVSIQYIHKSNPKHIKKFGIKLAYDNDR